MTDPTDPTEPDADMNYTTIDRIRDDIRSRYALPDEATLESWVEARADTRRRKRRLLTEQQYADFTSGRGLAANMRVRYVGPTQLEVSPETGHGLLRPTGQVGTIMRVDTTRAGRPVYLFEPDVPWRSRQLAEKGGMDVEVMRLQTTDWTLFERVT